MMYKMKLVAVAVMALGLGLGSLAQKTEADSMYGSSYTPEGIRIPATIELLASTPYYADPSQPVDEPEGTFAPQKVNVISTESSWSIGAATWKIETMFGPRWIRPNPWDINIAPPERITLLEETPLYRSQSTKGGSAASLSPQEVEVTGASDQWFYTNDPSSKTWIKVHTIWLGDLWAQIPVNRIGTVKKVQRKAHYHWLPTGSELGNAMGISPMKDDMQANIKGDFIIVGEFTTIYDRAFQVQMDQGTTWTRDKGIAILTTNETIEIASETPLISDIWDGWFKELAVLQGEKVTAFEKIEERLWTGRGPFPVWYNSTWYHVRTSKGTGWINKQYGEPESAVPVHWKVAIKDQKELNRYPGVPFASSALLLRDQTVEVTEVWDAANWGNTWLKVSAEGRSGWIPFWESGQDKLWDKETNTVLQITKTGTNSFGIAPSSHGDLKLYSDQKIGYEE